MDVAAKLTLIFSGAGAAAGVISGFLPNAWFALLVALILAYMTYKLAELSMRKSSAKPLTSAAQPHQPPQQQPQPQVPGQAPPTPAPSPVVTTFLPTIKKKTLLKNFALVYAKLVTKGEGQEKDIETKFYLWPYYIMWLIFWIMTYTLLLLG